MKWPVSRTRDYTIFFEEADFGPIVHMDVYSKWTKTLKLLVDEDLRYLDLVYGPLHVAYYPDQGEKQLKLLRMMGFEYHCKRIDDQDRLVDFYIKVL